MHHISFTTEAVGHVLFARMRRVLPDAAFEHDTERRDRGAVSLEQALWYAAAAVATAVVAGIIWAQVRTTAETPVQAPTAP
jgi:hypothetical protein